MKYWGRINFKCRLQRLLYRWQLLTTRLLSQGYQNPRLTVCLKTFYGCYHHLIDHYEISGILIDLSLNQWSVQLFSTWTYTGWHNGCHMWRRTFIHSSKAPDFTFNRGFILFFYYLTDFANVQAMLLLLVAMIWNDFIVDKFIGMRAQCCRVWIMILVL